MTASQWFPQWFQDPRMRLTPNGLLRYSVLAYHGTARRQGEGRKEEHAKCDHAHQKPGAARKCAAKLAARLNREQKS